MSDDWRPSGDGDCLMARASLLRGIRDFFEREDVLEVETPVLSSAGNSDPRIESLSIDINGQRFWLQTSPEFAMKRLLAAEHRAIYQICKVFRGGERGRNHNLEFTMLEWYRPGWTHFELMDEVARLIALALGRAALPTGTLTYREAMRTHGQIDPWLCGENDLRTAVGELGADASLDRDEALDLIFSVRVVPNLDPDSVIFIHAFPESQAALARLDEELGYPSARRFEAFFGGMELANGYHELTDPDEQEQRIKTELEQRRRAGLEQPTADHRLIKALQHGLPACAGVAMGIDRLLMLRSGARHIDEVLCFPVERA